jgi:hypothetical protein
MPTQGVGHSPQFWEVGLGRGWGCCASRVRSVGLVVVCSATLVALGGGSTSAAGVRGVPVWLGRALGPSVSRAVLVREPRPDVRVSLGRATRSRSGGSTRVSRLEQDAAHRFTVRAADRERRSVPLAQRWRWNPSASVADFDRPKAFTTSAALDARSSVGRSHSSNGRRSTTLSVSRGSGVGSSTGARLARTACTALARPGPVATCGNYDARETRRWQPIS